MTAKPRMHSNSTTVDNSSQESQEARAFLRERSLRLLSGIVGKKCELLTIENSTVTGEFRGTDINNHEFFIRNLLTPLGEIPGAIVRDQDIVEIFIPNICEQKELRKSFPKLSD